MNREFKSTAASVRMIAYVQPEGLIELEFCESLMIAEALNALNDGLITGFSGAQVRSYHWMEQCPDYMVGHTPDDESSSDCTKVVIYLWVIALALLLSLIL